MQVARVQDGNLRYAALLIGSQFPRGSSALSCRPHRPDEVAHLRKANLHQPPAMALSAFYQLIRRAYVPLGESGAPHCAEDCPGST
jgi:hypothetical protein